MENNLEKFGIILENGERVEWSGRPENVKLVDDQNRKNLTARWIITCAATVVLLVIYIILTSVIETLPFSILVPALILAAAGVTIFRPMVDAFTLRRQIYIATNRRLFSCREDGTCFEMPLEKIEIIRFVSKDRGLTDVIIGKEAVKRPYSKVRISAASPVSELVGSTYVVKGMAFFSISDSKKIRELVLPGTRVEDI